APSLILSIFLLLFLGNSRVHGRAKGSCRSFEDWTDSSAPLERQACFHNTQRTLRASRRCAQCQAIEPWDRFIVRSHNQLRDLMSAVPFALDARGVACVA